MPVRIQDAVVVEDVGCCDETAEQVLEAYLFALGKVAMRHDGVVWWKYMVVRLE